MDVHLVDGTYELFRQFFGQKARRTSAAGDDVAAVVGVLGSVLTMIGEGADHLAVATDHRIESFRNELWPGYKTSAGVAPELLAQFPVLEESLESLGVLVLAMDELEADDGLASAAAVAADDPAVDRVLIWTPDKDLAQCVRGRRVVQVDRRNNAVVDEDGVREKFGVLPASIPDYLALVGDSADGFPGLAGWGKHSAAAVLSHYHHLEKIPEQADAWDPAVRTRLRNAPALAERLRTERELALLFRELATLRVDRSLVTATAEFSWHGPRPDFDETAEFLSSARLAERALELAPSR
ncbi:MAG TPA: 5'-3' exonuclease H3TH domain-containing protein [Acidimicrobiales bacterium]|nr:5'-3' exonuclease H3TH domain-containing protein [Acidimicrobiales bacterium]